MSPWLEKLGSCSQPHRRHGLVNWFTHQPIGSPMLPLLILIAMFPVALGAVFDWHPAPQEQVCMDYLIR